MIDTQLIFVVGSGRCGTKMIKKLLAGIPHIEARHEYMRNAYQRESAMYYLGKYSFAQMATQLYDIYHSAAHYSKAQIFLDSSQHLAWCVDVLAQIFPRANFVHLVRDGRKVVSSFFNKLDIFDDYANKVMWNWIEGRDTILPPRDEKFWMPEDGDKFERICKHWVDTNATIHFHMGRVPLNQRLFLRLEDLVTSKDEMRRFLAFVDTEYNDSFHDAMQKQDHVYVPVDYSLTEQQHKIFYRLCGDMMKTLGYEGKEEYSVNYQM